MFIGIQLAEFIAAGEIQELFLEISHVPPIYTSMLQAGENTILTILHLGEQLKALDSKCFQFIMDNLMEKKNKKFSKFIISLHYCWVAIMSRLVQW